MSKVSRAIGAAMLCLGLLVPAGAVFAKQDPAPAKPEKEQKMKTTTINGTVSAVTDSTLTIVDNKQAEHVLSVTSETKVTKNGKDAVLADVKANDVVTIEAEKGEDNAWKALKISVS
jgi:CBS-domain-containing membrane protein